MHLRLAVGAAHLGFDLPLLAVGANVDVSAPEPDVAIPPVMLNSHVSNLGHPSTFLRGANLWNFGDARSEPHCLIRWIRAG